jgi:hypothetical protein
MYFAKTGIEVDMLTAAKILATTSYSLATLDILTLSSFLQALAGFGSAIKITSQDLDEAFIGDFIS